MPEGFVLAVDFEKAYNTITFKYAHVMCWLPTSMIALMMQLLQSPVFFWYSRHHDTGCRLDPQSRNQAGGPICPGSFCTLGFGDYPHFADKASGFMRVHVCR